MVKTIVLTVAGSIAVAWLTVLGLTPATAFTPATASAFAGQSGTAVLAASVELTPQAQACADFATWERNPSRANLERLVHDSFRVPGFGSAGLASDIGQLYADVAGGGTKYIASDEKYISEDGC